MEVGRKILIKNPPVKECIISPEKKEPSDFVFSNYMNGQDTSNGQIDTPKNIQGPSKSREEIREHYLARQRERNLKIFESAYEEAIRREKLPPRQHKLSIHLHCETKYGENVFLVGSHPDLGNWQPSKSIPLSWNPGNIWTCALPFPNNMIKTEFKFIIKNGEYVSWESCDNHVFRNHHINDATETKIHLKWNSTKY